MITLNHLPAPLVRWLALLPAGGDLLAQRAFARYHDRVNHVAMRWGMYAGALLWLLGGVMGFVLRPWNTEGLLQSLGIAIPFYISVGVALGNPRFRGHYQWLAALCNLTSGLLLFDVAERLPAPALTKLVGLIIITFHAVLGLRLRVMYALPVMLVYNVLYVVRLWSAPVPDVESAIVATCLAGIALIGAVSAAFILEANLWSLFRSRSVKRQRQLRPGHRVSALPTDLVRRWAAHPGLVADHPEDLHVLVVQAELAGADEVEPWERLNARHRLFARFDALLERRGLERAWMNGGHYVVAVPGREADRAEVVATLALAMLHVAEEMGDARSGVWEVRIGIDQGKAVRGAIGHVRPAYEVVGAAMDGALQLAARACAGCILVSARIQQAIDAHYETQERDQARLNGAPVFLLWGVRPMHARQRSRGLRAAFMGLLPVAAACSSLPAQGQWSRVEAIPPFDVPALHVAGDVLHAGTDSTVWSSTDGIAWTRGSTLPQAPVFVDAIARMGDTLYAGTGGRGLFASPDEGATWIERNNGLTGLGSTYINGFAQRGEERFCSTVGAGVFLQGPGGWEPFGELASVNAGNVDMIRAIGDTLWVGAGGNGYLWRSLPGADDLGPILVAPLEWDAHSITDIVRVGGALLVGGTYGVYRSTDGGDTWNWSGAGLPGGGVIRFLHVNGALFALRTGAVSRLYVSLDDGSTWSPRESMPLCYAIAAFHGRLYAARVDGLWVRDLAVGMPPEPRPCDVLFEAYPNPATDAVWIELTGSVEATYTLHDAQGRLVQQGRLPEERTSVPLTGLAKGAHVLRVSRNGQVRHQRLMVQ